MYDRLGMYSKRTCTYCNRPKNYYNNYKCSGAGKEDAEVFGCSVCVSLQNAFVGFAEDFRLALDHACDCIRPILPIHKWFHLGEGRLTLAIWVTSTTVIGSSAVCCYDMNPFFGGHCDLPPSMQRMCDLPQWWTARRHCVCYRCRLSSLCIPYRRRLTLSRDSEQQCREHSVSCCQRECFGWLHGCAWGCLWSLFQLTVHQCFFVKKIYRY